MAEEQDVRPIPIVPNIHPDDKPANEYPTQSSQLEPTENDAAVQAGVAEQTEPAESGGFLSAAYDYKFVVILIVVILIIAIIAYVFYKRQNNDKNQKKSKQKIGGSGGSSGSGNSGGAAQPMPPPAIEQPPSKEELMAELAAQRRQQEIRKQETHSQELVEEEGAPPQQLSQHTPSAQALPLQPSPEVCARREECMMYDVDVGGDDITAVVDVVTDAVVDTTESTDSNADNSLFSFNDISEDGSGSTPTTPPEQSQVLDDSVYEGFDDEYVDVDADITSGSDTTESTDQEPDRCTQILASGNRCKVRATAGTKCRRHAKA